MKEFLKNIGKTEIRNILAIIYTVLVLVYIYVLVFKPVPSENKDLVNILGGTVIGGLGVILSFYFGASKSDVDNRKP